MSKKYIEIDGKKHYIKDEEVKKEKKDNVKTDAEKIAKDIVAQIGGQIDDLDVIKNLNKQVKNLIDASNPADDRMKELLNGKDMRTDELTRDEKIVAFYYACATNNVDAVKALSEGTNADGGFLVPDEFKNTLIKELETQAVVRQLATVVTMKRKVLDLTSIVSGPQAYWTLENEAKSTTTMHFGQPVLTARKLAAILYSSDELIDDAVDVNLVDVIIKAFVDRIAQMEDRAFAQGNGTTQPTGLTTAVTAGNIPTVATVGSFDFDDVINLEYSLGKQYRKKAKYLAHKDNIKALRTMKDNDGRYIWQPSTIEGEPDKLNGRSFIELDDLPVNQIYFGDFKYGYYWGDRQKITVLLSQHTTQAFTQDETAIRIVERVAGNVVWGNAIRCLTGVR